MEYLTQVISVLITHTIDAIKKGITIMTQQLQQPQQISRSLSLLLMGVGTKQDKEIKIL
jgi:hypothetical protein